MDFRFGMFSEAYIELLTNSGTMGLQNLYTRTKWYQTGNLLNINRDFLNNRKRRVVLNGQVSTWIGVNAEVPQGSILGLLLFLIYINDLPDNLSSNVKLFTDVTSLFSVFHDINVFAGELNEDFKQISD